jgi:hypothetical protein
MIGIISYKSWGDVLKYNYIYICTREVYIIDL